MEEPTAEVMLSRGGGDEERGGAGKECTDGNTEVVCVRLGTRQPRDQQIHPIAMPLDAPLGLEPAARGDGDVAFAPQDAAEVSAEVRLVVHDENGFSSEEVAHAAPGGRDAM